MPFSRYFVIEHIARRLTQRRFQMVTAAGHKRDNGLAFQNTALPLMDSYRMDMNHSTVLGL